MQKVFRKNTVIIMTIAIFSILIINFILTMYSFRNQQHEAFNYKIDQVIHTLENNQEELDTIKSNLDEDYLTRAKAAAYVIEKNPEVLESVLELKKLAQLLGVDELHVINGEGILCYSSVPEYIGMDFHDGEQTRGFVPILESDDENAYVIQEAQPNTAEGKIMKYVGVSRKGEKGIVQVGIEPVRQLEAQEKNTYEYIFSRFPTDMGEAIFAVDCNTNEVLGHSGSVSEQDREEYHQVDRFVGCESGKTVEMEEAMRCYVVTRRYGDVLIGVSIPEHLLFTKIWKNTGTMFLYLLIVEIILVVLLEYLVKSKVIDGIHGILKSLSDITNGNLDIKVAVGGNREFEELSYGINTMVKSIVNTSDRISKIIKLSEVPLAAFEYQNDMKHVFVTSGFKELIQLSPEEINRLCGMPEMFYRKIQEIRAVPAKGETDIYQTGSKTYVRIHLSEEKTGYLGVVIDVSADMLQKQQMQYENSHDQLTGLLRYDDYKQQMEEILRDAPTEKMSACVMIDLDGFKSINDTYGHDAGDRYLLAFAEMLKELPKEHCLPARRSGDEFCLFIFDCCDKEEINSCVDQFWMMLKERKVEFTADHAQAISASGGITYIKDVFDDLNLFLKQADEALYMAKRNGKGHCVEYMTE